MHHVIVFPKCFPKPKNNNLNRSFDDIATGAMINMFFIREWTSMLTTNRTIRLFQTGPLFNKKYSRLVLLSFRTFTFASSLLERPKTLKGDQSRPLQAAPDFLHAQWHLGVFPTSKNCSCIISVKLISLFYFILHSSNNTKKSMQSTIHILLTLYVFLCPIEHTSYLI